MIKMYKCVESDTLPSNTADQVFQVTINHYKELHLYFENEILCWILI